jgi:hypothetical protein
MASTLKKAIPAAVLVILGMGLLALLQHWSGALDREIAGIMADRVMAQHRAAREAIIAKYAKLNAAKDKELATFKSGNEALAAKVVAKQRELNIKDGTLAETRATLTECNRFLGEVSYEYSQRLLKADQLRLEQLAIKDAEIAEWRARDEASTKTIGQLTKQLVVATSKDKRRLIIGPQVGYGINGGYVGFGATIKFFALRAPGQ